MKVLSNEFYVLLTAMAPYAELRLAIPVALNFGLSAYEAFILSVIGNMIPVIPLMLLIEPISRWLGHIPILKKFFDYVFAKGRRHQGKVHKYGYWGLTIFIAIPLPMTGAWMGTVLAVVMGLRKRYAFIAILLGVLIAGLIMTIATYGLAHLLS